MSKVKSLGVAITREIKDRQVTVTARHGSRWVNVRSALTKPERVRTGWSTRQVHRVRQQGYHLDDRRWSSTSTELTAAERKAGLSLIAEIEAVMQP